MSEVAQPGCYGDRCARHHLSELKTMAWEAERGGPSVATGRTLADAALVMRNTVSRTIRCPGANRYGRRTASGTGLVRRDGREHPSRTAQLATRRIPVAPDQY